MGWQYSSAGLSAGSQAAPLVGPDGASTSSASNIGNQRDATGPRCRVGRSQVHRGISEIDGRPNLGPFCREPKMEPGQVCPVAGRRSAVAIPRSRLPVLPAVETDRRQPQKSFCRETTSRRGSTDSTSQANRLEFTTGTGLAVHLLSALQGVSILAHTFHDSGLVATETKAPQELDSKLVRHQAG